MGVMKRLYALRHLGRVDEPRLSRPPPPPVDRAARRVAAAYRRSKAVPMQMFADEERGWTMTLGADAIRAGREALTPPQREVFDMLLRFLDRHGYGPSPEDIAAALHRAYELGVIEDPGPPED